jgi:Ca2+-binding RTX toxin-like protein
MAKRLLILLLLASAFLLAPLPSSAAELPADCAVPPEIDLSQFNVVIGTNASETLTGTEGADFICGLLGDDVIYAYGGDDLILGDTTTFFGNVQAPGGNDTIVAGAGDDQVLPGPGNDSVNGGGGDDFIALAVGDDVAQGGRGADTIIGGFGEDKVLGGPGNDDLAGGFGDDLINGGPGDDTLAGELPGGGPSPVPAPESRRDRCIGAAGNDTAIECDKTTGVEG